MRLDARFLQKILISIAAPAIFITPAFGSACTSASNPCTNSSNTGQDSTDRSTFNLANSDLLFSNITFNDATGTYGPSTSGLNSQTNASAVLDGVSFIGCISSSYADCASNSGGLMVQNSSNTAGSWNGGTDPALRNSSTGFVDQITATLPPGVYAIAFDILMPQNISTSSLTTLGVVINNGSPQMTATAVNLPGSVFFGYRSATAIRSVTIFSGNSFELLGIDNFELGAPASEAATLLMVGSGLLILQWMRRRFS